MIIINFTGHKLSKFVLERFDNEFKDYKIVDQPVHVDLSGDVKKQIFKVVENIQVYLLGDDGVAVILPPISYVAVILVSLLHGSLGNFPFVIPLIRDKDKRVYVVSDIVDLAGLRNSSRIAKNKFLKNSPVDSERYLK